MTLGDTGCEYTPGSKDLITVGCTSGTLPPIAPGDIPKEGVEGVLATMSPLAPPNPRDAGVEGDVSRPPPVS
tara:strand:+ start:448 stop:663 length:216 start_codon:yes stop_codon:yes gene_type:complete